MSQESLSKFLQFLGENEVAQAKMKDFEGKPDALVAYAREHGYDITRQDIEEHRNKVVNLFKAKVEKIEHARPGIMSLKKLLLLSETDKNVANRLADVDSEGIIAIGKELGYNFDKEDLRIFADEITEQEEELSDEELELVAGGIVIASVAAVVSAVAGVVCAVTAVVGNVSAGASKR